MFDQTFFAKESFKMPGSQSDLTFRFLLLSFIFMRNHEIYFVSAHLPPQVALKLDKAVSELTSRCKEWDQVEKLGIKIDVANKCLMKLSRILDPINYTVAGKYGHDKWGDLPKPIPGLQNIGEFASIDPNSGKFAALKTELIRERNKVSNSLEKVVTLINNTLEKLL